MQGTSTTVTGRDADAIFGDGSVDWCRQNISLHFMPGTNVVLYVATPMQQTVFRRVFRLAEWGERKEQH